ncbi:hypothetical protein TNCV_4131641 [Trichonephila clavipes]|nr:hypothetical protein TNCV_4131641 [Trichonephila clavipes]
MSAEMRLPIVWPERAAIKILCMMAALLFQKLLHETNKMSVGSRPPYMNGMKETILLLRCLGQAVGEKKLLLLGFAVDILDINGIWRVLKLTLLVRIAM